MAKHVYNDKLINEIRQMPESSVHLDEIDQRILAILMADGRASNVEIARTVGASEATVRRRIQSMIDDETIQVIAVADPYRIGLQVHVIIGITANLNHVHDVAEGLSTLKPIRFLAYTTGPYDLIAQAYFANNEELFHFVTDQLASIPGIVKTETVSVLKITKRTWDFQLGSPEIKQSIPV
jgi:Lrp/AsnC family transcriptional regulator for asnA, asnC and gidA